MYPDLKLMHHPLSAELFGQLCVFELVGDVSNAVKRENVKIKMHKMADAIMSDKTRDFWSEIRKLKIPNSVIRNVIDGYNDVDDIMNVFRDQYMALYNSVPYDECEIKSIIETY